MGIRKTDYYNPKNYRNKEKYWIKTISDIRSRKKLTICKKKIGLLVLDMQNIFLKPEFHAYIPSSKNIITNILLLLHKFKELNQPVVFTKHITNPTHNDNMHKWWKNIISESEIQSEIISDFNQNDGFILKKSQYSAFFETDLDHILKRKNITQLIITGVMTHLCCESTARDGFMKGYEIWFPINATASYNEQLHLGTLCSITHGFGECVLVQDLINYLN